MFESERLVAAAGVEPAGMALCAVVGRKGSHRCGPPQCSRTYNVMIMARFSASARTKRVSQILQYLFGLLVYKLTGGRCATLFQCKAYSIAVNAWPALPHLF